MEEQKKQTHNNRRYFIKQAALGIAGGFALPGVLPGRAGGYHPQENDTFGFAAQPVLTNIQANQVEIIVAPTLLSTGWVEYGPTERLGNKAIHNVFGRFDFSDRVLRFVLEDLEPGTTYYYRVHLQKVEFHTNWRMERTTEIETDMFQFKTLNPNAETATFTCWNDTHENEETIKKLAGLLDQQKPDFMVWNGDITNDIFREEQIVGQFLNPAGQAYATTIPMLLARGNHDVRGQDAPWLEDYITGPKGKYYFGFRQGPVASLVLDSGEDKPDDHEEYGGLADFTAYRSKQAEWLASAIEENWFKSAPFRIVFVHIPMVWNGESRYRIWDGECMGWLCEESFTKWHNLFEKANIQVVISGHTHRHRFIPPDDERSYGQLIGGGPQPDRATCITGKADAHSLTIEMTDLNGAIIEKLSYTA